MYIGLTGYMGSGKGVLSRIFQNKGFKYCSLSDAVRNEASKRDLNHSRENLQNIGNELREKFGGGVFAQKTRQKIENETYDQWIIDGIRNPAEIRELRQLGNFYLLGVNASEETLIKRIKNRKRDNDTLNDEQIKLKLDREKGIYEPEHGQQVARCLEMIDYLVINECNLQQIENKIDHFLGLIKGSTRHTFDEIFMEIAYTWSKRATCLRRRVGAVIAKDHQQLTAGYNGAPRKIPHCADVGGCLRTKLNIPSGKNHEICRGIHAEQNVIAQAAKFGIDISGSTLYCNTFPCVICTKIILNAGINKIVYDSDYNDPLSKQLLAEQNEVEVVRYEGWKKFNYL